MLFQKSPRDAGAADPERRTERGWVREGEERRGGAAATA